MPQPVDLLLAVFMYLLEMSEHVAVLTTRDNMATNICNIHLMVLTTGSNMAASIYAVHLISIDLLIRNMRNKLGKRLPSLWLCSRLYKSEKQWTVLTC